jgi:hypothetical protein
VLRCRPDGLPTAETAKAPLRTGEAIFAIGNHGGSPLASFGIVALATGSWRSSRGGTIDNFLRLDLTLSPAAEGGALVDTHGRVLGMTVLGPLHCARLPRLGGCSDQPHLPLCAEDAGSIAPPCPEALCSPNHYRWSY